MNRKITAAVAFDTPERRVRIDASAQKLGFEVRWVENGKVTAEDVQDCEIFFGMLPPELLRQAKSLKWLQCSFAGVDRYADQAQYAENIAITNASGAYGITISEHMVVTLLMLMRRMPEYHEMQKKREWYCVGQIKSVMNSVITVVGVGDIGSNFAKRVLPMGAFVRGVRRTEGPKPDFVDEIYTVDRLDEAITGADVVALCLPGTGETRRLFDRERMLKMKPGAILMNVGRGNAVDLSGPGRAFALRAPGRRGHRRHRARAPSARASAVDSAACAHHSAYFGQYIASADMRHHCRHLFRQFGAVFQGAGASASCQFENGLLIAKKLSISMVLAFSVPKSFKRILT